MTYLKGSSALWCTEVTTNLNLEMHNGRIWTWSSCDFCEDNPQTSFAESGVFATMSELLDCFAFFASGDANERFYIFLYPQKCEDFFKSGKPVFQC